MDSENREQDELDYLLYNKLVNDKENEKNKTTQESKKKETTQGSGGVSFLGRPLKHWKLWGALSWILVFLYFFIVLTRE